LQGVGGSFEIEEGENLISDSKSELVFIGRMENVDVSF